MLEFSTPSAPNTEQSRICRQEYADHLARRTKQLVGQCLENIENRHGNNSSLIVLDMDGTLYPHDGDNNGFKGSTKEKLLTKGFTEFIQKKEPDLSQEEAATLFASSFKNPIGPSVFFAERYECSRNSIFDEIWGPLEPVHVMGTPNSMTARILQDIRSRAIGTMLLTAAPRVWKNKVLPHLGIKPEMFDGIMTTEDFTSKDAVFHEIRSMRPAINAISIGDSLSSDILPARHMGFRAIHVNASVQLEDIPHLLFQDEQ